MRTTLVSALSACVCDRRKAVARRFLQGLSSDELQYIADFLGACILDATGGCAAPPADEIAAFERCRHPAAERDDALEDHQHKMILLVEYLSRCEVRQLIPALRTSGHAR